MSLSIIVMGASGRMGTTIANLAKEQGMTLAAVLERPERLDALAHWGCLAGTDPEVVYPQVPGILRHLKRASPMPGAPSRTATLSSSGRRASPRSKRRSWMQSPKTDGCFGPRT